MCFVNSGLTEAGKEQAAAYKTATAQAATEFQDAGRVFNDLMKSMEPIALAGPGQTGWTANEASAVDAATVDTTASAYRNAAGAVRSGEAAIGGGNIALPSGANIGTELTLAEAGAQEEATGLRENKLANLKQGNENWQFAEKGISAAPGVFSTANQATGEATQAGTASANTEVAINNASNSWQQLVTGALGDVAAAFVPGGALAKTASKAVTSTGQSQG